MCPPGFYFPDTIFFNVFCCPFSFKQGHQPARPHGWPLSQTARLGTGMQAQGAHRVALSESGGSPALVGVSKLQWLQVLHGGRQPGEPLTVPTSVPATGHSHSGCPVVTPGPRPGTRAPGPHPRLSSASSPPSRPPTPPRSIFFSFSLRTAPGLVLSSDT